MSHSRVECGMRILLVLGLTAGLFGGCSDDSTDPDDTIIIDPSPIGGTLSRDHRTDAGQDAFNDTLEFWIATEKMGAITKLRVGAYVDETPEPGDPDGFEFQLAPESGVLLFNASQNVMIELLDTADELLTSAHFEAPAADVTILSPVQDEQVFREGFELQWRGDGLGIVGIRMISLVDETSWETAAENNGSYQVSATKLADFPKGPCTIEIVRESTSLLTSVELGSGTMILLMSASVDVGLGN